ncbi:GIY-YIG nuclease family protein [Salibacter sp.]|uniref:GIY-YIG nuclease family protein n=1 Tax=Salibacter sp. TaxID=2010995 RepID=UPI0028702899|nr:GIY-YIG nuclease family protein [Salibacter sp.]MDR9488582.1 GIY-YIG nuclease family protein [Salibacter sp.]
MSYHVYVLYSFSVDKFYKVYTNNLEERINRHNSGREISTKFGAPWSLIWTTEKKSASKAMTLERKLKNLSRQRLLIFMNKYDIGLVNQEVFNKIQSHSSSS